MSTRLFEVAQELGKSPEELLEVIEQQGFKWKKNIRKGPSLRLSVLEDEHVDQLRGVFNKPDDSGESEQVKPGVMRRRLPRRGEEAVEAAPAPATAAPAPAPAPAPVVAPVAAPVEAPAAAPAAPVVEEAPAAPARRRSMATVVTREPAPEPTPTVAETPAPEPVVAPAVPVEHARPAADAHVATGEPTNAPAVRRRRMETVNTRPPEAAPVVEAPAPVAEAVAEAGTEAEAGPRRPRMSTIVTRETPAVRADGPNGASTGPDYSASAGSEGEVEGDAPARRSRFATITTGTVEAPDSGHSMSPVEMAAAARREADARAASRSTGGARVVGAISSEVLSTRMETDRRDSMMPRPQAPRPGVGVDVRDARPVRDDDRRGGAPAAGGAPGAASRAAEKKGKRVVQSRDLYDPSAAGRGRPGAKQKKGGLPMRGGPQPVAARPGPMAEHKRVVKMEDTIVVSDMAQQMGVKGGEIAMKLMFELGMKGVNINTTVDLETAQLIAELYGFKIEQVGFDINKFLPKISEDPAAQKRRPPVVTVMGHVDHGKTSLLDAIRSTSVAAREAGGITQHIGAYVVQASNGPICFLDTPGHEAFTALRARGAKATDITILVVAADDGVMPQTLEAINHCKAANVPMIVAINKMDKPGANPDRIKQKLSELELVPEEWGGDTIFVQTSAKTRDGIDHLLEMVNLKADIMDLTADPDCYASGLVVESKLDPGRGPVASVLVQAGTLKTGQMIVIGQFFGRVRTMTDEWGRRMKEATPSTPVELTGLSGVPDAGQTFYVLDEEKNAKTIAEHFARQARQSELAQSVAAKGGMEGINEYMRAGKAKEVKVIIKADVQGSVEAIAQALQKLSTDEVSVRIIHSAVGSITENDVNLAMSSSEGASVLITGFNVRPEARAAALAEQSNVGIFTNSIIYEIIDRVKQLMVGMLEPIYVEEVLGHAEVRALFQIPKIGTIAGCSVTDGKLERSGKTRIIRDGKVIYESDFGSLRHFEKDVKEVKQGFECGLTISRYNDLKVGDVIECFKLNATAATL